MFGQLELARFQDLGYLRIFHHGFRRENCVPRVRTVERLVTEREYFLRSLMVLGLQVGQAAAQNNDINGPRSDQTKGKSSIIDPKGDNELGQNGISRIEDIRRTATCSSRRSRNSRSVAPPRKRICRSRTVSPSRFRSEPRFPSKGAPAIFRNRLQTPSAPARNCNTSWHRIGWYSSTSAPRGLSRLFRASGERQRS